MLSLRSGSGVDGMFEAGDVGGGVNMSRKAVLSTGSFYSVNTCL